ncbi:4Fe-4S ferredoxin-type domain-containing protein, partial [Dysosmobacter welbionis]
SNKRPKRRCRWSRSSSAVTPAFTAGAAESGTSPFTSSSRDTPNTPLSFTNFSKSGTLASFSHLLTDCRDT